MYSQYDGEYLLLEIYSNRDAAVSATVANSTFGVAPLPFAKIAPSIFTNN
jgi:hypothetical protein